MDAEECRISLPRLLALFLKIGTLGFGGGMAIIALMEFEIVRKRALLPLDEFLHGVGFGQILGSFAVNTAVFVGCRLYGVAGGILSATAFLLPPVAMVIALSDLYFRYHAIPALAGAVAGLGPVVIALIVEAGWSIGARIVRSPAGVIVAVLAFAAGASRVNALWVLLAAGAAGILMHARRADTQTQPVALLAFVPTPVVATLGVTFFKVGLVFFGGGFLLLPVLHQHLVTQLHWLTTREFIDGVAISNLTPGPVAVLATFAGYRQAGIWGALVATVALMAPATALVLFLTTQYRRFEHDGRFERLLAGLNPAIAGLILSAAVVLGGGILTSWRSWLFAAACLAVLRRWQWPPVVLLGIGALGGYFGWLA